MGGAIKDGCSEQLRNTSRAPSGSFPSCFQHMNTIHASSPSIPSSQSSPTPSIVGGSASGQTDEPTRKRRKVKRTRTGCLTCRKRRKLCDQERPLCGACVRLKLDCQWPPEPHSQTVIPTSESAIQAPVASGPRVFQPQLHVLPHHGVTPLSITSTASSNARFSSSHVFNDSSAPWSTGSLDDLRVIFGDRAEEHTSASTSRIVRTPINDKSQSQVYASSATLSSLGHDSSQSNAYSAHTDPNNFGLPLSHQPTSQISPSLFNPSETVNASALQDPLFSILDDMNFDEATLQLWAAGCLAIPTTQTIDPFQNLSDLLRPSHDPPSINDATSQDLPVGIQLPPHLQSSSRQTGHAETVLVAQGRQSSPTAASPHHAHLLKHYQASLSSLVSCTGDSETVPSAFAAFTKLAEASSSSEAGQGLHLSILAWAGRHMVNQGQVKYEAVSERLGDKASRIIMSRLHDWKQGPAGAVSETERMTLLAGALMVVQFKVGIWYAERSWPRIGDVWGFDGLVGYLRQLSDSLYQVGSPGAPPDSMPFSFFENLVYHDLLSSFAYSSGPLVPYSVIVAYSNSSSDFLHTLTGACFPLFCKMHRVASLTTQRRKKAKLREQNRSASSGAGRDYQDPLWTDEELYDLVHAADEVEAQLAEEKRAMETLVKSKPNISSHRFLHEAFRIACLMALHSFVFCEPPSTFRIQLLVRQSLSLLEEMYEKSLPGFCSAHWVLFVTALCCCNDSSVTFNSADEDSRNDCQRIEKLYDSMLSDFAFGNVTRSRKIFREVWTQNEHGRKFVDWVNVVDDFDWEIFMV